MKLLRCDEYAATAQHRDIWEGSGKIEIYTSKIVVSYVLVWYNVSMNDSPLTLVMKHTPPRVTEAGKDYAFSILQNSALIKDSVAYFKAFTDTKNPDLNILMGSLAGQVSREDFSRFCHSFAEGVDYVRDKYKTQPSAIIITDETDITVCANADTYAIRIPRKFILNGLKSQWETQGKTEPYTLDSFQMAAMYGVEEAYHVHQFASNPAYWEQKLREQTLAPGHPDYDKQPLEAAAKLVVQQALIDFGYAHNSPIRVCNLKTEDMAWAKKILHERTHIGDESPLLKK
jgi:hypothetical protein